VERVPAGATVDLVVFGARNDVAVEVNDEPAGAHRDRRFRSRPFVRAHEIDGSEEQGDELLDQL